MITLSYSIKYKFNVLIWKFYLITCFNLKIEFLTIERFRFMNYSRKLEPNLKLLLNIFKELAILVYIMDSIIPKSYFYPKFSYFLCK